MPEIIVITLQTIILILMGMYRDQHYLWLAIMCSLCNACLYFGAKLNQGIYFVVMTIPMVNTYRNFGKEPNLSTWKLFIACYTTQH